MWLHKKWSKNHINELKEVEITQEKQKNKFVQLNKDEAWQLLGLAEQLNWIASQTRPVIT